MVISLEVIKPSALTLPGIHGGALHNHILELGVV
jgi:hypothetical protein